MLSDLEYGALLAYAPYGTSEEAQRSINLRTQLKSNSMIGEPPRAFSVYFAERLPSLLERLSQFASFFGPETTLVPVPRSALQKPGSLWVPLQLAKALASAGLGGGVLACLQRKKPVPKSAWSKRGERTTAREHYDSLRVSKELFNPKSLLPVDDVVTSGATLLGAASRLSEAFPGVPTRAFAAMRAVSNPEEFEKILDSRTGTIRLLPNGKTRRTP